MSSSQHFSVGAIGAGTLAQAIAGHAVAAGHRVIFSNSRGPESLEPLASRFGANASAGTVAEAARADIVILAVGWEQVPAAVKDVPDWNGRIVIDATNQWQDFSRGIAADLGDQTGSERNAALMPEARVVKAFRALRPDHRAEPPPHRWPPCRLPRRRRRGRQGHRLSVCRLDGIRARRPRRTA
jgi:8-hydroxy-5-deazaflavin:NADPH oxidoreductase